MGQAPGRQLVSSCLTPPTGVGGGWLASGVACGLFSMWSPIFQQAGAGSFLLQKPGGEKGRERRGKKLRTGATSLLPCSTDQSQSQGRVRSRDGIAALTHRIAPEFKEAISWGNDAINLPQQHSHDSCLILKPCSCLHRTLSTNTYTASAGPSHILPQCLCPALAPFSTRWTKHHRSQL